MTLTIRATTSTKLKLSNLCAEDTRFILKKPKRMSSWTIRDTSKELTETLTSRPSNFASRLNKQNLVEN